MRYISPLVDAVKLNFVKDIEVTVEKTKKDVPILGQLQPGNKTTGLKYSGSTTIYDVTPIFKQMFLKLQNEGVDTYFDMQIDSMNDDFKQEIKINGYYRIFNNVFNKNYTREEYDNIQNWLIDNCELFE